MQGMPRRTRAGNSPQSLMCLISGTCHGLHAVALFRCFICVSPAPTAGQPVRSVEDVAPWDGLRSHPGGQGQCHLSRQQRAVCGTVAAGGGGGVPAYVSKDWKRPLL